MVRPEDQDLGDKDLVQPSPLKKQISGMLISAIYLSARERVHEHNSLLSMYNSAKSKNVMICITYLYYD